MIEIVKPEFVVGSEKRFFDFISKLNEKDKLALISHTDLDGLSAAKIANEVLKAEVIKFVSYTDLNDNLIKELKKEGVKKIFLTDLAIDNISFLKAAEKEFDILMVDHHQFLEDFNSEKTVFLNVPEYCATYLCYYLFSKVQNLEKYDWLVACASLADFTVDKNRNWMQNIFKKYSDNNEIDPRVNKGKISEFKELIDYAIIYSKSKDDLNYVFRNLPEKFGELNGLKDGVAAVKNEVDSFIKKIIKHKEEINGRFFCIVDPKFNIVSNISTFLANMYPDKTIIIGRKKDDSYYLSARRQDRGENMNLLLKKLVEGFENSGAGGHIPAAGGFINEKFFPEFKKRLESLK